MSSAAICALSTFAPAPSSQTIGKAASAVFAWYHLSATTATALSSTATTWRTPGIDLILSASKDVQLAAEHRALRDRGVQHVGQLHVDGEDLLARQLVHGVEPLHALPMIVHSAGVLSFTSVGTGSFAAAAASSP